MTVPVLKATLLSDPEEGTAKPTLLLGPSLGTSASTLWSRAAQLLSDGYRVVGWDLPGHGNSPRPVAGFSMAELASGVAGLLEGMRQHGELGEHPVYYAGDSLGGAVGLQLGLDFPDLFAGIGVLCSAAKIGEKQGWLDRAATVAAQGTPTMIVGSGQRWFAPGFMEREPEVSSRLLHALSDTDQRGYALCCEALANFDVRDRLAQISTPIIAVSGEHDTVTPYEDAWNLARGVRHGSAELVPGAGHLVPVEKPERTAEILTRYFGRWARLGAGTASASVSALSSASASASASVSAPEGRLLADPVFGAAASPSLARSRARLPGDPYDAGMAVRREVLGDDHVNRATAAIDDITAEFQEMITRFAWGTVWTRPGLPRTTRSAITLTALIAHGHWEELAMHLRAALRNGLTREEITEIILQSAIYCGVPSANSAFRIAQRVLNEVPDPE